MEVMSMNHIEPNACEKFDACHLFNRSSVHLNERCESVCGEPKTTRKMKGVHGIVDSFFSRRRHAVRRRAEPDLRITKGVKEWVKKLPQ